MRDFSSLGRKKKEKKISSVFKINGEKFERLRKIAQEIEKKLQPPEDIESTPLVSYDKKNSIMTDLAVYENI